MLNDIMLSYTACNNEKQLRLLFLLVFGMYSLRGVVCLCRYIYTSLCSTFISKFITAFLVNTNVDLYTKRTILTLDFDSINMIFTVFKFINTF